MPTLRTLLAPLAFALALPLLAAEPKLPGVAAAIQPSLDAHDIAGAVTLVIAKDKTVHFETHGFADVATQRPLTADTMFNIMSMTKPVTATAILMLQDEGKLSVADPRRETSPRVCRPQDTVRPARQSHNHPTPHAHVRPRRGLRSRRAIRQNPRRPRAALARGPHEV